MAIDKLSLPSKENAIQTKVNELVDTVNAIVEYTALEVETLWSSVE